MRQLLVHADDLGLCEAVNAGIAHTFREGIVRSASLMANGRAFADACRVLREHPGLDVGVHLSLVQERPVLPATRVTSLIDGDGRFVGSVHELLMRYLRRRVRLNEVRMECEAQLEMVLDHGVRPSHVDSHQHVHMLPGVFDVVTEVALRHGIAAIRLPREPLRLPGRWTTAGLKRACEAAALRLCCVGRARPPLRTVDTFAGFIQGGALDRAALMEVIGRLPAGGTCELMCHPGLARQGHPYAHWGYDWQAETQALTDPQVRRLIDARGITLVSYRDAFAA